MAAGTPAADRWLVAEIGFYDLSVSIQADPASVVIGGVIASLKSSTNGAADSGNFAAAIYSYWALVPGGVTADVTITLPVNANASVFGVSLYAVTGADLSAPVVAAAKTASQIGFTSVTSGLISVPVGGALIAMGTSINGSGPGPGWTNATLDAAFNGAAGNDCYSSASRMTAGNNFAVTYADSQGILKVMQINCVAIQKALPVDFSQFGIIGVATSEW